MSSSSEIRRVSPEDVIVTSRGPVPHGIIEQAKEQVAHATRLSGRDVHSATVTLTESTNPSMAEPSRAEVMFNISGTLLRAEADAPTPAQALDGVVDRIERRIVDLVNRWDDRSRWLSVTQDGQWKRGDPPAERPEHFPRPYDEREVVRRKTFAVTPTTVQEAIYDMEALEHDFHLFTDVATGTPALVHRYEDGSYGIAGLGDDETGPVAMITESTTPILGEVAARQRLDASGEPFVFYIDEKTGKGSVVYLRYDGHYGVITAS
ncbi:MAG: HPF/RaiA family ribosome-associated protein [Aquihabitans sp.]